MDKEITLNETQLNLLKEYLAADTEYNKAYAAVRRNDDMPNQHEKLSSEFHRTYNIRTRCACIFAASVAAEVRP